MRWCSTCASMKAWLRLTLITMMVGGGFTGLVVTLQALIRSQDQPPAYFVLMGAFLALYAFVTVSGLLFVENPKKTGPLLLAIALQIPWISSPFITYRFAAGAQVSLGFIGGKVVGGVRLGSDWEFYFLSRIHWGLGVNLFAVLILILLLRSREASTKRQQ